MADQIFITGGTGFLGSYIIRELVTRGYSVKALRRSSALPFYIDPSVWDKVQWIEGDVLDVVALDEAMKNTDIVIHSAAKVSFHKADRGLMYKTNVEGTANVVNAALENNIRRLVHISSVAAIGRSSTGEEVSESSEWKRTKTTTHYAVTKYLSEMEAWRGFGEGLDTVIANPSTIIGYGDWNTTSCAIFKNVYNEFPWYTEGLNGFVEVQDVARAVADLMESGISGERFIINGDNWSFRNLFTAIAQGLGKKPPYKKATPFLGEIAWRIEKIKSLFTGKRPLLTRESARVAHSKTNFSNRKLREALPDFSFTPLEQSIENACKKYLNPVQPL